MTWSISAYVPVADIADRPVGYVWKDHDPLFYYREDLRFEKRIACISVRGIVALSAGMAEWVAARWPKLAEPALLPEIEAVWAAISDWRRRRPVMSVPQSPRGDAGRGPQRGPICDAFYSLSSVADRAQRSGSTLAHCATLSQLAIHVLPDPGRFQTWRRDVIERLASLYPRKQDEPLGPSVPREALDLQFPFQPDMADELLAKFLAGLDPVRNPFLQNPDEVK